MRKSKIDLAVDALNASRGLKYPMVGHMRYANITGDGRNYRSLYVIINDDGGVTYSSLNGASRVKTLANLRNALLGS